MNNYPYPQKPGFGTTQQPWPAMGAAPQRPAAGTGFQRPVGNTVPPRPVPPGQGQPGLRPGAGGAQKPAGSILNLTGAPQRLTVGIADMKILQWDGELITFALGSCIGICLYEPNIKLAALIHIMLPINMETGRKNTMKYADTGIRETLRQLEAKGARKERLVAKIAGGAKMFEVSGNSSLGNIGGRNIESVRMNLRKEGVRILSENVGGSVARTLSFFPATGIGKIKAYGQPDITL